VAFGEDLAGFDGDEAAEGGEFGAESSPRRRISSPRLGAGRCATRGRRRWLARCLGYGGWGDGGDVRDDFAGDGGADGEVAVGVGGGGDT